jgi:hypothetical protein
MRNGPVQPIRLASGHRLDSIARDAGGGTYFLCREGGEERPVLHLDHHRTRLFDSLGLPPSDRLAFSLAHEDTTVEYARAPVGPRSRSGTRPMICSRAYTSEREQLQDRGGVGLLVNPRI